jgi:hypothetical protein
MANKYFESFLKFFKSVQVLTKGLEKVFFIVFLDIFDELKGLINRIGTFGCKMRIDFGLFSLNLISKCLNGLEKINYVLANKIKLIDRG